MRVNAEQQARLAEACAEVYRGIAEAGPLIPTSRWRSPGESMRQDRRRRGEARERQIMWTERAAVWRAKL